MNEIGKSLNPNYLEIKGLDGLEETSPIRECLSPKKTSFLSLFEMSKKKVAEMESRKINDNMKVVNITNYFFFR